jgi:hypothetical protein
MDVIERFFAGRDEQDDRVPIPKIEKTELLKVARR